jgi:hypothetical protein
MQSLNSTVEKPLVLLKGSLVVSTQRWAKTYSIFKSPMNWSLREQARLQHLTAKAVAALSSRFLLPTTHLNSAGVSSVELA